MPRVRTDRGVGLSGGPKPWQRGPFNPDRPHSTAPSRTGDSMPNPLTLKLEHGADLRDEDRRRLDALISRNRQVSAHEDLIREGEAPDDVHLVLDGLACRYKLLPNGRRQIVAFLVPGDFCDLHVAILSEMDHSIATVTPCTVVDVPRAAIDELTACHPRITRALWWATLVDEGTLREWLTNMGQRPADQRLAHLLCELLTRLQIVGRSSGNSYELPLTQVELGETLGLSTVHVNRTLQRLREEGLITLRGGILTIPDVGRLKQRAEFEPRYLHLRTAAKNGHGTVRQQPRLD